MNRQQLCDVKQSAMTPQIVSAGATLDFWSHEPWTNGVQIEQMDEMEMLLVRTRNSLYEITVMDGWRGEIVVRGGQFFPHATPAWLAGCLLYTSPSPRDPKTSRMPSSA